MSDQPKLPEEPSIVRLKLKIGKRFSLILGSKDRDDPKSIMDHVRWFVRTAVDVFTAPFRDVELRYDGGAELEIESDDPELVADLAAQATAHRATERALEENERERPVKKIPSKSSKRSPASPEKVLDTQAELRAYLEQMQRDGYRINIEDLADLDDDDLTG